MPIDVTDATFDAEVMARSETTPVVVDLWAEWCGPCRTLGPILERVIDATAGQVVLAKVDVDANPSVSAAFRVQGIPAVYAVKGGKVVNGFVGAQPEAEVTAFVATLLPGAEETEIDGLLAQGDEASLREALEIDPAHAAVIVALAEILVGTERADEALALIGRIPESPETRRVAALARTGVSADDIDVDARLAALLPEVRDDEVARREFVDLLELLGPDDPRTAAWRKELTGRLF